MPLTLDDAIKTHLANKRKYLESIISEAVIRHTQLHISIFERTPKDDKVIKRRIIAKEKEKDRARYAITTEHLWTEIQALQELLAMVRKHERGESLDGLTY
jgi:hypothetical protein